MRSKIILGVFLLVVAAFPALAQETVDVVKVHGIVEISEEEIISIAGVKPGDVLTSDLLDKIRSNLLSTGKFSSVEVLKRYRSLTDSSKVSVIILVEEKQSFFNRFMYLPVVGFTDGKLLYGGVVGSTDLLGFGEHISAPVIMEGSDINTIGLTTFFDSENLLFNRITFSAMKTSTENMHFEIDDERIFVNANIAKRVGPLFISLNGGYEEVKFAELEDKYYTVGGLAVFDTRRDVLLPSDAVYAGFNWQRYDEKDGEKNTIFKLSILGGLNLLLVDP